MLNPTPYHTITGTTYQRVQNTRDNTNAMLSITDPSSRNLSEQSHSTVDESVMDTVGKRENNRLVVKALVEAGMS